MPGWVFNSRVIFRALIALAVLVVGAGVAAADEMPGEPVRVPEEPSRRVPAEPPREEPGLLVPWTPLQLSAFAPAQVFADGIPVNGLRLNLIYGEQKIVRGVDVGAFNKVTSQLRGIQLGLLNDVSGSLRGAQLGLVNWTNGSFAGFQVGVVNEVDGDGLGVQLGFANVSEKLTGLQLGFYNRAQLLKGVQIGFINMNVTGQPLSFFPVVNIGW